MVKHVCNVLLSYSFSSNEPTLVSSSSSSVSTTTLSQMTAAQKGNSNHASLQDLKTPSKEDMKKMTSKSQQNINTIATPQEQLPPSTKELSKHSSSDSINTVQQKQKNGGRPESLDLKV